MLSWHATRRSIEIAKPLVVTSVASDLILQSVAGRAFLDAAVPLPCLGRPALRVASPPMERTSTNSPCTERPCRTPPTLNEYYEYTVGLQASCLCAARTSLPAPFPAGATLLFLQRAEPA